MLVLQGPKQSVTRLVFTPNSRGVAAVTKEKATYWPTLNAPPVTFRRLVWQGFDIAAD